MRMYRLKIIWINKKDTSLEDKDPPFIFPETYWIHSLGIWPEWESNVQPFSVQDDAPAHAPHQPGVSCFLKVRHLSGFYFIPTQAEQLAVAITGGTKFPLGSAGNSGHKPQSLAFVSDTENRNAERGNTASLWLFLLLKGCINHNSRNRNSVPRTKLQRESFPLKPGWHRSYRSASAYTPKPRLPPERMLRPGASLLLSDLRGPYLPVSGKSSESRNSELNIKNNSMKA